MTRRRIERQPTPKWIRLNRQTPDVTQCAWPGCDDKRVRDGQRADGVRVPGLRVGVLCWTHADAIADAVLEERVRLADFRHHDLNAEYDAAVRREEQKREQRAKRDAEIAEQRGGHLGFVYYLRIGDRIKVGFSTDVRRRMRQYPPTSELLAVEPGDYTSERARHEQFAGSRADGREWFRPTADLLEHIDRMVTEHGDPKRHAYHYRTTQSPMRLRRPA